MRVVDEIVELYVSNIDQQGLPEYALGQLRRHFFEALADGAPGHVALRQHGLYGTTLRPEEAVLNIRKLPRRGSAMVEVANAQVAEFFCSASYHRLQGEAEGLHTHGVGINCAQPGVRPRCVNIHRNPRRRRNSLGASRASEAVMQDLEVVRVSLVDLDVRERQPTVVQRDSKRARGEMLHPARTLWDCNIEMVRCYPPSLHAPRRRHRGGAWRRPQLWHSIQTRRRAPSSVWARGRRKRPCAFQGCLCMHVGEEAFGRAWVAPRWSCRNGTGTHACRRESI